MPENCNRNYDVKVVARSQAGSYQAFGWIRSKESVPAGTKIKPRTKEPLVMLKRKLEFGLNPKLASVEKEYTKLSKKKYRSKPILGILSFILMLAFLLVAGVELYFGISDGLEKMELASPETSTDEEVNSEEETADNASAQENDTVNEETTGDNQAEEETTDNSSTGILDKLKEILETVRADYLSKVTNVFDGKVDEATDEYTPGISDTLSESLGTPISYFISGDTIVGIIALILGIIFIIIFAKVCGIKKRRIKKNVKMDDLREEAIDITNMMRKNDPSLMGRIQRKQYMWETIITNAIRNANTNGDSDDDD